MELNEVVEQCLADSLEWFPDTAGRLDFLTLCLAGEVGELANEVKKGVRGSHTLEEQYLKTVEEAGDVFIYLMNIFGVLGVDPIKEYERKRAINVERFGHGR